MAIGVKLEWHPERLTRALGGHMREKLGITGELLVGEAKHLAPVQTGNLRNSIDYIVIGDGIDSTLIYGSHVEYSIYNELGWLSSRGVFTQHPFLLPALLQNMDKVRRVLNG